MMSEVEAFIDQLGLHAVANALADIAYAKGEHIEANGQNPKEARPWFSNGASSTRPPTQ
jgi:hypothetical protein